MLKTHSPTYKKNEKHKNRQRAEEKVADRNARQQVGRIADQLASTLRGLGFTVHRCESKSTASTYLCVDYGLGNTIRISDHRDNGRRPFRYNVLLCQEDYAEEHGPDWDRFFYPADSVDRCAADVSGRVVERIKAMGTQGYLAEKDRLRVEKDGKPGFWENAEEVENDG